MCVCVILIINLWVIGFSRYENLNKKLYHISRQFKRKGKIKRRGWWLVFFLKKINDKVVIFNIKALWSLIKI
jgi:hypothetical protein